VRLHILLMLVVAPLAEAAPEPLLPPCPSSPNCVSSLASDNHFIPPLKITGGASAAFTRLRDLLKKRHDATVVAADEARLQVEFRTFTGFVDEATFVLDGAGGVIHVRSAARSGWWDLGKNRRRIEEIRKEFEK
jgi:uncharacterized protein (DUF1499 family)